jgi:hypothetical protein
MKKLIFSCKKYQTKPSSFEILNHVSNLDAQPFSKPAYL